MQITNIQTNQPNFNGRYLIKDGKAFKDIIEKTIIPLYEAEKRKPIASLIPEDLLNEYLSKQVNQIAKHSGYGKEWLIQNAKLHGVDVNFSKSNDVFIFSGEDFTDIYKYLIKSSKKEKVYNIFSALKSIFSNSEMEEHVRLLNQVNEIVKRNRKILYDFMYSKNVCEVKSLNELADKLSKE